MKRGMILLYVSLMLMALSSAGQKARVMESLSMYSKILGGEIKYSVCLPADYYKTNKKYPVVYALHGLGSNESSWLEYGRIGRTADLAVANRQIIPMIYIMPQAFSTYYVNDYASTYRYQDMFMQELIPYIDSVYRTQGGRARATIGISMGGFGALILPMERPDLFTACVPLSVSIRTDQQYMTERSDEWNEKWGRLFGGVNTTGPARITDYYKKHSPMHMLADSDPVRWKGLRIYIDNGDDEQTLAYSNEELHYLLREKNIPHEYRVRNGGHEFGYWRDALPNGLRFISDAMEGKPYRGDIELKGINRRKSRHSPLQSVIVGERSLQAYFPRKYNIEQRLYPVIYVIGDLSPADQEHFSKVADRMMRNDELPPFIMIFLPETERDLENDIIPEVEKKYRVRPGFRNRSLFTTGKGAWALAYALTPERYTSCTVMEPSAEEGYFKKITEHTVAKKIERTWFFFGTSDKTPDYRASGDLHLLFKEKSIYHEYRVMQRTDNDDWKTLFLEEAFRFAIKKMHR
ncbi:MAG TPA: alpha/beta hydrolase-fold protein [Flavitalea sp.]|nr:alpha/beta hydrolase-fold protein [Flavitalea sp.]